MSRFHELWVITRANNRGSIERSLAGSPLHNVHFVYYDLPRWASFWKKQQRGIHLYYFLWQIGAYFVARRLHRQINFELTHHVTFGQYWTPSLLPLLPVPFVWGPVGGGESAPAKFWWGFSSYGKLWETSRDLARFLASFNPILRIGARRSGIAIATTEQTAVRLRKLGAKNVTVHPQFGMNAEDMETFVKLAPKTSGPFRLVSIGRLIHWKGFHLGLHAFAKFQQTHPESEYWITSPGPELAALKALAKELNLESKVVFWGGFATLDEVYKKLEQCDVLVHPALHEAFGNVCLEAMAAGRPVICLDLGGPALQVTENTGIKVRATSPTQTAEDLAAAFSRLADDPTLRMRLGGAARNRAEVDFSWDKKGAWMNRVYSLVSKSQASRRETELVQVVPES
jgi:glycosyltransferase involved in cell wall biosynthesis